MESHSTRTVILTRFSPYILLRDRFSGEAGRTTYYFDLYGKSHGLFTTLAMRGIGVERFSAILEKTFRFLGVILKKIPHAESVKDYHVLQLNVERNAKEYLDRYYRSDDYRCILPFPDGFLDKDCADSLFLKNIGMRIWYVVENIRVVQSLTTDKVYLYVDEGEFPSAILNDIAAREDAALVSTQRHDRLLNMVIFILFFSAKALSKMTRLRAIKDQAVGNAERRYVAVEFVDPSCNTGKASAPNYIAKGGVANEDIIAYYRGTQKRRFSSGKFSLPEDIRIVDLDTLPLAWSELSLLLSGYFKILLWNCSRSTYYILKQMENLEILVDLSALLRTFPVRAHIYNTFPNGVVQTYRDSGVVTGVCHRFNVHSIGYQTRVCYNHGVYNFFDAFDTLCMWGQSWIDEYRSPQFIKDYRIIGDVHLDAYKNLEIGKVADAVNNRTRNLLLFTGDAHFFEPSHYTFDYTKTFLLETIKAVGEANKHDNGVTFRLLLKTKDPEHVSIILNDEEITALLQSYDLELTPRVRARHDVEAAIEEADIVLSIGFTSPGLDALLLGKPSAYFTPYGNLNYNMIFNVKNGKNPLVVHNASEIRAFLEGSAPIDPDILNGLDPFRDGKACTRLGAFVNELLEGGRDAT